MPASNGSLGTPQTILVVSDLHLGFGFDEHTQRYHRRENFFADAVFGRFLQYHRPSAGASTTLVLNGDILDFLRIDELPGKERGDFERWSQWLEALGKPHAAAELERSVRSWKERRFGLKTTDLKSAWKLRRMVDGHSGFFRALGEWVQHGGRIVFVKGNHDLELHWPLIQDGIRHACGLERGSRAWDEIRFEESSYRACNVYVEHGHQYERMTRVLGDHALLPGGRELNLPLGSFVNRYVINRLEGIEPFLDNIKPVQDLLFAIARRHPVRALAKSAFSFVFVLRAWRRLRWWWDSKVVLLYFVAVLSMALTAVALVGGGLAYIVFDGFRDWVADLSTRVRVAAGIGGIVAGALPWIIGFARDVFPKRRPKGFENEVGERVHAALERSGLERGYQRLYAVLGHTHCPEVQRLPRLEGSTAEVFYLNCGTWTGTWRKERPDLTGRFVCSFIRFDLNEHGAYEHRFLEWRDDRGGPADLPVVDESRLR